MIINILAVGKLDGFFPFLLQFAWFIVKTILVVAPIIGLIYCIAKFQAKKRSAARLRVAEETKKIMLESLKKRHSYVNLDIKEMGFFNDFNFQSIEHFISQLEKSTVRKRGLFLRMPYLKMDILHDFYNSYILISSHHMNTHYTKWGGAINWNRYIYRYSKSTKKGYWYKTHWLSISTLFVWLKLLNRLDYLNVRFDNPYIIVHAIKLRLWYMRKR